MSYTNSAGSYYICYGFNHKYMMYYYRIHCSLSNKNYNIGQAPECSILYLIYLHRVWHLETEQAKRALQYVCCVFF